MFEPLWKANYVDSVPVTMAEDIIIGFAPTTTTASALPATPSTCQLSADRHGEPVHFTPEIRAEKEKVLSAVRTCRGPGHRYRARPVREAAGERPGARNCADLPRGGRHPRRRATDRASPRSILLVDTLGGRSLTCAPASASVNASPRSPSSLTLRPHFPSATRPQRVCSGTRSSSASRMVTTLKARVRGTSMQVRDVTMDLPTAMRPPRTHPGLRASHPRCARRVRCSHQREGQAIVEDPRPDPVLLGDPGPARTTRRAWGPSPRTTCWPGWPFLIITLKDATSPVASHRGCATGGNARPSAASPHSSSAYPT